MAGTAYAASQASVADLHDTVGLTGLTSTFLGYAVWMVFGVLAVSHLEPLVSWQNLVYAVPSLTVLRMIPWSQRYGSWANRHSGESVGPAT